MQPGNNQEVMRQLQLYGVRPVLQRSADMDNKERIYLRQKNQVFRGEWVSIPTSASPNAYERIPWAQYLEQPWALWEMKVVLSQMDIA